ncbi:MAG TPA: LemA family protein [Candidatus Nanoarchaeia archaeon]|nr:LemA family protein [Candidatus Nanoarchaeia archaeon]
MYGKWILCGVLGLALVAVCSSYNGLVTLDETATTSWAQVQNQYQRRYDLVPNLVETVKGYAEHEKSSFIAVTEARAKVGQMNVNAEDAASLQQFFQVQDQLKSALSRLLVVMENYPVLKANESFLKLQDELAGTENRIAVERRRFNEAVRGLNQRVRRFPGNLVAGIFGIGRREYFDAEEQAQSAPQVNFGAGNQ